MQFIGEYQIDPQICSNLIKLHRAANKRGLVQRGKLGVDGSYKVDTDKKDSYDLGVEMIPEDLAIKFGLPDYYQALKDCVDQYFNERELLKCMAPMELSESPIIQHYEPGGGFKLPHFERTNLMSSRRALVWMTYLNDVTDQGGTHFHSQNYTATPKAGKTLVWPTDFTHSHEGVVSPTQDKYIITGWLSFAA